MKQKPLIIGTVIVLLGAIVLIGILAFRGGGGQEKSKIDSVTVQKDGNTLIISRDGRVSFEKNGKTYEDYWDSDKLNAFFGYVDGKYGGSGELVTGGENYVVVSSGGEDTTHSLPDDELIDEIEDETEGPPSPTATAGQGGSGNPTPTPTQGQGGSGGGPDPECLYWRLSYCVRPRTPSPSPSATPEVVEIREPDCGANTQTGRTVIGNDLCLPTPSPTPTQQ